MERRLQAFITAPMTIDTSAVRALLREHQVDPQDAFDFSPGDPVHDLVLSRIRNSDFVIAILDHATPSVWWELGVAQGVGKPILLLAEIEVEIPATLQAEARLRPWQLGSDVGRITLQKFIEDIRLRGQARGKKKTAVGTKPTLEQPRREEIKRILKQLRQARSSLSGLEAMMLTASLLRAAGVDAVETEPQLADRGADFAVWSNALAHTIGNPILVELKVGELGTGRLREAEQQVLRLMGRANVPAGLLLYLDRSGRRSKLEYTGNPYVLKYDLEDFASALLEKPFTAVLLERRNQLVHGVHE